ncbi:MAG: hypothetical protein QOG98_1, partial [Pseudonocardiales bacterium]|nr:hypothetical protein [Pseudonocardiales bacterium]
MNGMLMRRLIFPGVIALTASAVLMGSASANTRTASFGFRYAYSYGKHGLSQPYAGPSTTAQSYGTGVAIRASDIRQQVYSLVE